MIKSKKVSTHKNSPRKKLNPSESPDGTTHHNNNNHHHHQSHNSHHNNSQKKKANKSIMQQSM